MILAGDVGGTKTELALFEGERVALHCVERTRYPSRDYGGLDEIVSDFVAGREDLALEAACFGVAGPVTEGIVDATNLPWHIESGALARSLGLGRVELLNDVEAAAYGMLRLHEDRWAVLNPGVRSDLRGNVAVLAAGTGLGEAILYWDGDEHHAIASEGGHADFAPHGDREIELLRYLRARYGGHVSSERVLSGSGLTAVYAFLQERAGVPQPGWLAEAIRQGDPAAAIARAGLAGDDGICVEALDLFAHAYGVEAGNLALKCLARGGVFLGGGMAPKLLPALQSGAFMRGFTDKGRFTELLRGIRVCVALDTHTALLGAAARAAALARR